MSLSNKPLPWQFDPADSYHMILYEGTVVGFCKPDYTGKIVEILNNEDKNYKALLLACSDLLTLSGENNSQKIDGLVKKYLEKAERPKQGNRLIAYLLRDRQKELDLNPQEFVSFCDSYRLSLQDLKDIFAGKDISNNQLGSIARILGKSMEDMIEMRDGK